MSIFNLRKKVKLIGGIAEILIIANTKIGNVLGKKKKPLVHRATFTEHVVQQKQQQLMAELL